MRNVLTKMVNAAMIAKNLDEGLLKNGYPSNPYGDIYGEIADAIYNLLEENTFRFEDSKTFIALNADSITDETKVEFLLIHYNNKNQPALV